MSPIDSAGFCRPVPRHAISRFFSTLPGKLLLLASLAALSSCGGAGNSAPQPPAPATYAIGGTVSGLSGSGLVLQNNAGDDLSIAADGRFRFSTPLANGAAYAVTVKTQPRVPPQTCSVSGGSGTVNAGAVTGVTVNCVAPTPRVAYVPVFGGNNISAYAIDAASGTLTALPGSPFAVRNFPTSLALDPRGRFAYVRHHDGTTNVDEYGNFIPTPGEITGYAIDAASGSLAPLTGSPLAVGLVFNAIAVDPSGRFAYATAPGRILAYAIDAASGALAPLPGSPFAVAADVRAMAFDPEGRFLYAADSSNVFAHAIDAASGALAAVPGSPFAAGISGIASITIDPRGKFAYAPSDNQTTIVDELGNITTTSKLAAFAIDAASGSLTPLAGSPRTFQHTIQGVTIDPAGRAAYMGSGLTGVFGYTIDAGSGALTPLAGSPFAAGRNPRVLTIDPSGKFAYGSGNCSHSCNDISIYAIDAASGALSAVGSVPANRPGPVAIVAR